jgi:hypothetical protein
MRPSTTIELLPKTIEAIRTSSDDMEELILIDFERNQESITEMLKHYESDKEATGQVYNYDDIVILSMTQEGQGDITINFTVFVYSGCRDINANIEEKISAEIRVDFGGQTATLIGQELMPERDPDEF